MDSCPTLESKPVLDAQQAPQLQPKDKKFWDRDDSSYLVIEQTQTEGVVSPVLPDAICEDTLVGQ